MKAGLTAAVMAVQALQAAGVTLRGDVLLQSVIGEETGGAGTLATIVHGYRADACVIMEPLDLRICPVHSGALTFRLTVHGRGAHASMKPHGVSAIQEFMPLLAAIEQLNTDRHQRHRHPLFEEPHNIAPISIGTVRAGDWPSSVPDLLVAEGRFGVFPDETVDEARAALAAVVREASAGSAWLAEHPPTIEWVEGQFESGVTPHDADIVRVVGDAHAELHGTRPALVGLTAGTDLRLFTRHAGIPTILYGPGQLHLAHAADEYVQVSQIVDCARVLARTMIEWCGT
jgi:acetylornithine deacetylase